mmetsp:Transcript_49731/g.125266  ORF Transcript_49731/g.125266 Transcript_49731/m.125266 type:complete len:275 (+) Transcript_49731:1113-1937(+)
MSSKSQPSSLPHPSALSTLPPLAAPTTVAAGAASADLARNSSASISATLRRSAASVRASLRPCSSCSPLRISSTCFSAAASRSAANLRASWKPSSFSLATWWSFSCSSLNLLVSFSAALTLSAASCKAWWSSISRPLANSSSLSACSALVSSALDAASPDAVAAVPPEGALMLSPRSMSQPSLPSPHPSSILDASADFACLSATSFSAAAAAAAPSWGLAFSFSPKSKSQPSSLSVQPVAADGAAGVAARGTGDVAAALASSNCCFTSVSCSIA